MADKYSMIKSIEITNFMSIEYAKLEFDETNVISICGFNDSGKSAITRAISVIFYDNYSRDQIKFIKEGKDHFKVQLNFDDGVTISKTKYDNGASVWVFTQNNKLLYTNQLKTGIQAVADVPDPIKTYLGVIYDDCTDSLINVRRNSDRLFLIDTTGGDNYKILNTILKSDVLAKASMAMTADKNKLNTELQVKTNTFNTYVQQYEAIEVAPLADIEMLRKQITALSELNMQFMSLENAYTAKKSVDEFIVPDELPIVDLTRYAEIKELGTLQKESAEIIPDELSSVDMDRYNVIVSLIDLYKNSEGIVQPEAEPVMVERLKALESILKDVMQYNTELEKDKGTEAELNAVIAELKVLSEKYNYKICKNCGAVVF